MCKLIYSMTVSLDGYISGPQGEFDWTAPDEELHRFPNDQVRELGGHLLGRRLYEVMSYWETAEELNPAAPQYALEFGSHLEGPAQDRVLEHAHDGRGQDEALERGSGRGGPEAALRGPDERKNAP